jgi:hypothetical protein
LTQKLKGTGYEKAMLLYPETEESLVLSEEINSIRNAERMERYYNRTPEQIIRDRQRANNTLNNRLNNMTKNEREDYKNRKNEQNRKYRASLTEKQIKIQRLKDKLRRQKKKIGTF